MSKTYRVIRNGFDEITTDAPHASDCILSIEEAPEVLSGEDCKPFATVTAPTVEVEGEWIPEIREKATVLETSYDMVKIVFFSDKSIRWYKACDLRIA